MIILYIILLFWFIGAQSSFLLYYLHIKREKKIFNKKKYTIGIIISFFSWITWYVLILERNISKKVGKTNDDFIYW